MDFVGVDIVFSKGDILRKITLPNSLDKNLAELMGVIIGDGHLENKKYNTTRMYCLVISGSYSKDFLYYSEYINKKFKKLFNLGLSIFKYRNDELVARIYSKAIISFLITVGIPFGNKTRRNCVPDIIKSSDKNIKAGFLRGLFDTDGSIRYLKRKNSFFPIISLRTKSKFLKTDIIDLLTELGLKPRFCLEKNYDKRFEKEYPRYYIEIPNKNNLKKFMELIGFANKRHLNKILI